jgi:MFS family permease
MAVGTFVNTIGNGMYMTVMVMYFTRFVGLPAAQVGLGLTVAGLVGLAAGVPMGHLADRRGPREVSVLLGILSAVVMAAFVVVHAFWQFLLVAVAENLVASSARAARGGMIARFGGEEKAVFRAYLRSVTNVGIALGGVLGALALVFDTKAWYMALIGVNAASFVVSALITLRVPRVAPLPAPPGAGRWIALGDRRFLAVSGLMALMNMQFEVLMFAAPLWIAKLGHAPRWTVGALLIINTVLVAVLQVRMSRGVDTVAKGVRATIRSGWVFAAAAVLFGSIGWVPAWAAVVLLLVAAAVHSVGEIVQQAGVFELGYGLAADHAQGQYQGLFSMMTGGAIALAPGIYSLLCVDWAPAGWFVLGAVFAGAGCAMPWAVRVRPPALLAAAEAQAAVRAAHPATAQEQAAAV